MSSLLDTLQAQASAWSELEMIAVAAAVLYLLLAIRQNIACWIFALLSTAIYIYLFAEARLYMEAALNSFYFAMAVYGWVSWRHGGDNDLPVTSLGMRFHVIALACIVLIATANGWLLQHFTDAVFPYIDSLTTWAAIFSTWLVARKLLENWWYWLVIDLVSIAIYWSRGLELTSLLFVVYIIMIPIGYLSWRKSYQAPAT